MTGPRVVQTGGLGEALQSIGESLGKIIDPDKERREAFENMLISTPGAMSRVAQDIRQNPELAQNVLDFVSPEMREQIANTPQTNEQRLDEITRQGLASLVKQKEELVGQIAAANALGIGVEEITLLNERLRIINESIEVNQNAPPNEPGIITRGVERELAGGLTPGQIAQDRLSEDISTRAFDLMQVLPQININAAALRKELEEYYFNADNKRAHDQRMLLAGLTGPGAAEPGAADRAQINARRTEADNYVENTNVGTNPVWQQFLYDPASNIRGLQLARGEIAPTNASDVALQEVASAFLQIGENKRLGDLSSNVQVIQRLVGSIDATDRNGSIIKSRSLRETELEQLNDLFELVHNLSKSDENPEGTIPLREAFIPGRAEFAPMRVRDPVTGEEIDTRGPPGPNWFMQIFRGARNIFSRSEPSERGGQEPQSEIELRRGQTNLPSRAAPPANLVESMPPIDTVTVDMGGLQTDVSRNNLLLIQNGDRTFKELISDFPAGAVDILNNIRPEFRIPQVRILMDSLRQLIIEKADSTSGNLQGVKEPAQ